MGGCHHIPTPARAHQRVLFSRANLGSNFLGPDPLDNRPQSIGLFVNISLKSVILEKGGHGRSAARQVTGNSNAWPAL